MRIGIDARTILNPEKGEAIGVGHYTYQLIRHLLEIDQKNEYVLFFDFHVRQKDIKKFSRSNAKIRFYPFSDYKKYLPGIWLRRQKLQLILPIISLLFPDQFPGLQFPDRAFNSPYFIICFVVTYYFRKKYPLKKNIFIYIL